jgi:aspartate/methionine/tyrosine aminotransferase
MVTTNPAVRRGGTNPLAALREEVVRRRAAGRPLIDLSIGDPDEPTPDAVRAALKDAVGPVSDYPSGFGQAATRRAIADFVRRRHGAEVDPATQVLPTSGSKEAIFHLPFAFIDPAGPRRTVVWGSPGYPTYARGTRYAGGDHGYLRDQLEVARAHDILLCSDECYQELWSDEPAPSLLEVAGDGAAGMLAVLSLSKRSGMTGYRSGALVGDPTLIAQLRVLREDTGTASPDFVQAAAQVAWADDVHVAERRAIFIAKRDAVHDGLRALGLAWSASSAIFYVWIRVPGGDDLAYATALLDADLVVTPGRAFGAGGEGWIRLALVPDVNGCREAMQRWSEAQRQGALPA